MIDLDGILPPITTPFDEPGALDAGALAANVERYEEAGLAGYLALGSNGEAVHLDAAERRTVLETIRTAAPGRTLLAGVNELSSRAAVAAAGEAADAGADAVLVITPYFYKGAMTREVLRAFFLEVADASPRPVLIYNVPQNTGVVIDSATLAELAAHDNILGVKDSAGNFAALAETLRLAPRDFRVLVGNAGILYPALAMGATGAILAVACVAPAACVELHAAVRNGDHRRARDLQQRLAPLGSLVTSELGIAGLKAAMDLTGLRGGLPRRPLLAVGDGDRARLAAKLRESGLVAASPDPST